MMNLSDLELAAVAYLVAINLIAAGIFAYDKHRAVNHERRVPEATLLRLCAFGGAFGAFVAMHVVRHKTQKPRFKFGVPAMLLAQMLLAALVIWLAMGCPDFWNHLPIR